MASPELLDALPATGPDLDRVPDERARAMFGAFRLEITYDKPTHTARCRATLTADTLSVAVAAATGDGLATICDVPNGIRTRWLLLIITIEDSFRSPVPSRV